MIPSAHIRISVVFRDPRDVVISELRMRHRDKESNTYELNSFIYERFEVNIIGIESNVRVHLYHLAPLLNTL